MAAVQSSQIESLEVRESGRALKVQTDNPHLVSIGSGRLSTNVTWHPLPEGRWYLFLVILSKSLWVISRMKLLHLKNVVLREENCCFNLFVAKQNIYVTFLLDRQIAILQCEYKNMSTFCQTKKNLIAKT